MAHTKKSQTPKKETDLIKNEQKKVCELVISNFLMMSASTLEVPVQKNQVTIAAEQFAKARDALNAHVKISMMEKSILLEKDNAQKTIDKENDKYPLSTDVAMTKNKTSYNPKMIKEKSNKKTATRLIEAPSQNQCEEIISKFLAIKITEKRAAIIKYFANSEIPIENANSQKQINSKCIVQNIELNFSEDSKKASVLAFIKARDKLKAQVKIRFSKKGIILVKVEPLAKTFDKIQNI
jgi:hypothetical protein